MNDSKDFAAERGNKTTADWFVELESASDNQLASQQFDAWLSRDRRREAELARCEAALFLAKNVESAKRAKGAFRTPARPTRTPTRSIASALAWLKSPRLAWSVTAVCFLITVSVIVHPRLPWPGADAAKPDANADITDGLASALANPAPAVLLPKQVVVDAGSLAVLPFTIVARGNDGRSNGARAYASQLYGSILRHLASIPGIYVVDRQSVTPYVGTDMGIDEMAAQLGVRAIVQGRVESSDQRLRVTLRLTDAADNKQMWQSTFERPVGDVSRIASDMATDLASALAAANPSGRE